MLSQKLFYLSCAFILTTAALPLSSASAATMDKSHFAQTSKLSSTAGKFIKIRCSEAGVQQLTAAQLRQWGFSSISNVRVLGFNVTELHDNKLDAGTPDDLEVIPTYRTGSGDNARLFFYNPGIYCITVTADSAYPKKPRFSINENRYSDYTYYIVTDAMPGADDRMTEVYSKSTGKWLTNHISAQYSRSRELHPEEGGSFYIGEKTTDKLSYSFELTDPLRSTESRCNLNIRHGFEGTRNPTSLKLYPTLVDPDNAQLSDIKATTASNAYPQSEPYRYVGYTNWGNISFKITDTSSSSSAAYTNPLVLNVETANVASLPTHTLDNWISRHDEMVLYLRHNYLRTPQMLMYVNTYESSTTGIQLYKKAPASGSLPASSLTTTPIVWDVSNPSNIARINPQNTSTTWKYDFRTQAVQGCRQLIAFDPTQQQYIPEMVGTVEPQNLHAIGTGSDPVPTMVIITVDDYKAQAQRLADIHRKYQGMDVRVVTHDQIINEFGSGTPHAMAYRLFAKMLFERGRSNDASYQYDDEDIWHYDSDGKRTTVNDKSKFRYILLFGPMSHDNVHMAGPGNGYMLTYQAEDPFLTNVTTGNYALADYFGIVNDDFIGDRAHQMYASVAVGVIDAMTQADADQVVNKIDSYLKGFPGESDYFNRLTMIGDASRQFTEDSYNARGTAAAANPAGIIDNIYTELYDGNNSDRDQQVHSDIAASLNAGSYFFSYVGHSRADAFESVFPVWNNRLIASTYYDYKPFAVLGTCSTFTYDWYNNSLVHKFTAKADGGMMAVVAACREVYPAQNLQLAQEFTRRIFSAKPGMNIGDVYRATKRTLMRDNNMASNFFDDLTINSACYVLSGDPALPVIGLSHSAVLTEIAGKTPTDEEGTILVDPFSTVTLKGHIAALGNETTDASFNGTATITVLDGPERSTLNTMNMEWDDTQIAKFKVPVKEGVFEASFTMPMGNLPGISNRISIYAISDDKSLVATGTSKALVVKQVDMPESGDTEAPTIASMYLDNADTFTDGSIVSANPTIYATVKDAQTGIDVSGSLNSNLMLVLDGTTEFQNVLSRMTPGADNSMKLVYPLSNLADGRHSISLTVSDIAGNTATETINFTVVSTALKATLIIEDDPARDMMTYSIAETDIPENAEIMLVVRDMEGHTVYTANGIGTAGTWDLTGTDGKKIADGRYKANVIIREGNTYGHSPSVEFVVVK